MKKSIKLIFCGKNDAKLVVLQSGKKPQAPLN